MAIIVVCPTCKTRLTLGDERAGETIDCPDCDHAMAIPTLVSPPPAPKATVTRSDDEEDGAEAPAKLRKRNRGSFQCVYCGSTHLPTVRSRISTTGWVVFCLLLITVACFPLCIIGLFIKEEYRVCSDCGMTLGG